MKRSEEGVRISYELHDGGYPSKMGSVNEAWILYKSREFVQVLTNLSIFLTVLCVISHVNTKNSFFLKSFITSKVLVSITTGMVLLPIFKCLQHFTY